MEQQLLIDGILETVGEKIQEEVGALLDRQLDIAEPRHGPASKEEIFPSARKKYVLARIAVEGEMPGEIYLLTLLKDAILMGGTLIMLPPGELENRIRKDEFGDEGADAFGEIANIIAGAFTAAFDELSPRKLRFIKKDLEVFIPARVDLAAAPIPSGTCYRFSFPMAMEGRQIEALQVLFPMDLLGLDPRQGAPAEDSSTVVDPPKATAETGQTPAPADPADGLPGDGGEPLVLLVTDSASEARIFTEALQEGGYSVRILGIQDNLKDLGKGGRIAAAYLVMEEMTDIGFAAAIKIKAAGGRSLPLVVAAPQWTQKAVLQAVKYGACDILVTPATASEIVEKAHMHQAPD